MSSRRSSPSRRLEILEVPIFTLSLLTNTKLSVPLHGSLINRPDGLWLAASELFNPRQNLGKDLPAD
jgi:hypothetical protein